MTDIQIGFSKIECCDCGLEFFVPTAVNNAWRRQGSGFSCPRGHGLTYGDSEMDKLRRERDRLKQQMARKDDDIARQREMREAAERSAAAYKGQTTRLRKRAKHGVCPCCNRTFKDLARHMATKHADFDPDTDNVVELREIAK